MHVVQRGEREKNRTKRLTRLSLLIRSFLLSVHCLLFVP